MLISQSLSKKNFAQLLVHKKNSPLMLISMRMAVRQEASEEDLIAVGACNRAQTERVTADGNDLDSEDVQGSDEVG